MDAGTTSVRNVVCVFPVPDTTEGQSHEQETEDKVSRELQAILFVRFWSAGAE
jgi:hypothetical protein